MPGDIVQNETIKKTTKKKKTANKKISSIMQGEFIYWVNGVGLGTVPDEVKWEENKGQAGETQHY